MASGLEIVEGRFVPPANARANTSEMLPLEDYDHIIVSFSGGKDSVACVLHLLDIGVPPDCIELWHQAVDGEPGVDPRFMDWPCTEAYCRAFAEALGLTILFQWKNGGFRGEMMRQDEGTKPTTIELLNGNKVRARAGRVKPATRLKFPQTSKDLNVRWCSAYLKIDVASKVFTNDPRFDHSSTVICTGERRGESGGRALYAEVDKHKASSSKRRVDQWRPVINWPEDAVWEIIERHRIRPHPAYYLGWSRVSCLPCIFGNPDQWASIRKLDPELFQAINDLEDAFGVTIAPGADVAARADKGKSYLKRADARNIRLAMSEEYDAGLIITDKWTAPKGAFGHSGGPT